MSGHERALRELDSLLETYSNFSSPTLVHGDKEREKSKQNLGAVGGRSGKFGGMVVPQGVVSSDGKTVIICSSIVIEFVQETYTMRKESWDI